VLLFLPHIAIMRS